MLNSITKRSHDNSMISFDSNLKTAQEQVEKSLFNPFTPEGFPLTSKIVWR